MSLREDLESLQRDDLDAFILDKFPDVYLDLAQLMNRRAKVTELLLKYHKNQDLVAEAFAEWCLARPGAVRTRLLILLPSPRGTIPSESAAEASALRDALLRSTYGRSFEIRELSFVTADSLRNAIKDTRPHAVHIATHGERTSLEIQNERGEIANLLPQDFADIIRQAHRAARRSANDSILLITLSACFSDQYALALMPIASCAVGMTGLVECKNAIAYFTAFYKTLGDGQSVAEAFSVAGTNLSVHDSSFRNVPVLKPSEEVAKTICLHRLRARS